MGFFRTNLTSYILLLHSTSENMEIVHKKSYIEETVCNFSGLRQRIWENAVYDQVSSNDLDSVPSSFRKRFLCSNVSTEDTRKKLNGGTNWAVLVCGTKEYRHLADFCHANQITKKGVRPENTITFVDDNMAYSQKNPFKGVILNHYDGPNVYAGIQKDYAGKHATGQNFLNVLVGKKSAVTGRSGKVLNSGENDNVFCYITSHSNKSGFDMPQGDDEVSASDLIDALKYMHRNKAFRRMVILVEGCKAGGMFKDLPDDIDIYVITASNETEPRYACYEDYRVGDALGDTFSVAWMEYLERNDWSKITIDDLCKEGNALLRPLLLGETLRHQSSVADPRGVLGGRPTPFDCGAVVEVQSMF